VPWPIWAGPRSSNVTVTFATGRFPAAPHAKRLACAHWSGSGALAWIEQRPVLWLVVRSVLWRAMGPWGSARQMTHQQPINNETSQAIKTPDQANLKWTAGIDVSVAVLEPQVYIQQGTSSSVLGNCLDAAGTLGTGLVSRTLRGWNCKSISFCRELALLFSCLLSGCWGLGCLKIWVLRHHGGLADLPVVCESVG